MRSHNYCAWLKRGDTENCGKAYCDVYCKIHSFKIRHSRNIPLPCRICGKGVQSKIQLCCNSLAEKKKEIVKVNIEVVLIVLWWNCLQFDNPIKHRHLYTKTWDAAEKVWLNKAKTSQKLARIKKEENRSGGIKNIIFWFCQSDHSE